MELWVTPQLFSVHVTHSKYRSDADFIRAADQVLATPYTFMAAEDHEISSAITECRQQFDKVNK